MALLPVVKPLAVKVSVPLSKPATVVPRTSFPVNPTPAPTAAPVTLGPMPTMTAASSAPSASPSDIVNMLNPVPAGPSGGDVQHLPDPVTGAQTSLFYSGPPPQAALPIISDNMPKESLWHKIARWLHIAK